MFLELSNSSFHTKAVKKYLVLFLFFLSKPAAADTSALDALKPASWSNVLKAEPKDDSASLRLIQESDQIKALRSEGNWYEVDLTTANGLEFRGWIKGELAPERQPQERKISITQEKVADEKPDLESKNFKWFWNKGWEERGYVSLLGGLELIQLNQNGVNPDDERVSIPGYNFAGAQVGMNARLSLMQTRIKSVDLLTSLEGEYQFGFFQVRFANNFDPIDVAGDAYRIQTHRLKIGAWLETPFAFGESWKLQPGLGMGYFYFDIAPDLKRTSGGDVVFTQMNLSSAIASLRAALAWRDQLIFKPAFHFTFLSTLSESPDSGVNNDQSIRLSGLPLFLELETEYRWSPRWSAFLQASLLRFQAKHQGPSRRIDVNYTDVRLKFQEIQSALGIRLHY